MAPFVMTYRLDELTYDEFSPLGEGGSAELFRCTTAVGKPLILKRYHDEVRNAVDYDALRALIAFPAQLDASDRERLLTMCAWPEGLVVSFSDGRFVERGVVMPEAPPRFFLTRRGRLEPRHFSRTVVREDRAEKMGYEYFGFPEKIALLGHLLSGLLFLHSHDIVVGDLQWNGVLVTSPNPATGEVSPDVHFLDCDSYILAGRAAMPMMDPISWKPRFPTDGFSATTDMYKFALFVVRCLSERTNQDAVVPADHDRLLPTGDLHILHELLTSPSPNVGAHHLASMARVWQLRNRGVGVAPPAHVPPAPKQSFGGRYVFVSHSTVDSAIAMQVCAALEGEGLRCWIAPRDVAPGVGYPEQIVNAIEGASAMVVLVSDASLKSKHVAREVERADNVELWILPLRIESVALSGPLTYYFSSAHWFDAYTPPLAGHLERLVEVVRERVPVQEG